VLKFIKKHEHISSYLFFGGLTTVVALGSFMILHRLGIHYLISNAISWILAVSFAYITSKKFVFKSKDKYIKKELSRFFMSRIFSLGIDMTIMYIMVSILSIHEDISKIIASIAVVIVNYVLSRIMVFKNQNWKVK